MLVVKINFPFGIFNLDKNKSVGSNSSTTLKE
jgi:hypothetical protein